jgi:hypothetical protein
LQRRVAAAHHARAPFRDIGEGRRGRGRPEPSSWRGPVAWLVLGRGQGGEGGQVCVQQPSWREAPKQKPSSISSALYPSLYPRLYPSPSKSKCISESAGSRAGRLDASRVVLHRRRQLHGHDPRSHPRSALLQYTLTGHAHVPTVASRPPHPPRPAHIYPEQRRASQTGVPRPPGGRSCTSPTPPTRPTSPAPRLSPQCASCASSPVGGVEGTRGVELSGPSHHPGGPSPSPTPRASRPTLARV